MRIELSEDELSELERLYLRAELWRRELDLVYKKLTMAQEEIRTKLKEILDKRGLNASPEDLQPNFRDFRLESLELRNPPSS